MRAPVRALWGEAGLEVLRHEGPVALEALSARWGELDARHPRGPFSSYAWTAHWLRHFARDNPLHVLEARQGARTRGVAPFIEREGRLLGLPVRLWQSPSNEHSQRFEWSLDEDEASVGGALWEELKHAPWEVLLLKDVVESGPENAALLSGALRDGFLVSQWPSLESPWLRLDALHTSSKFQSNLRRRRKKLLELGEVRLERMTLGEGLTDFLDKGLRLEASGWKGKARTAMLSSSTTAAFYRELAHVAAREGWLSLYLLYAGPRPVAFHFGLIHEGTYFLLKPGYDETLGHCSVGQLLVEEVLRDLPQRGVQMFDFLGPRMDWKMEWTQSLRPHTWTFLLRPTPKGRLLHAARFHWAPRLKRWLEARLPARKTGAP